jgi:hypothetical protein
MGERGARWCGDPACGFEDCIYVREGMSRLPALVASLPEGSPEVEAAEPGGRVVPQCSDDRGWATCGDAGVGTEVGTEAAAAKGEG